MQRQLEPRKWIDWTLCSYCYLQSWSPSHPTHPKSPGIYPPELDWVGPEPGQTKELVLVPPGALLLC